MDPTEAFFDEFAGFYDAQHGASVDGDRGFYVEQAREADGPVLEVGCGTGRIYLELLREGVEATGIDVSREMLDELERKAAAENLDPDVYRADMTDFAFDREFALVIIPFRSFLHVTTRADQQATLRNVREVLADDGRLVLNFFPPNVDLICEHYGEIQATTVRRDGTAYHVEKETRFADELERVVRTEMRLYDDDWNRIRRSDYRLKLVTKPEFELLLETVGFTEWAVFGGFAREPLDSVDQELVWVVRR